MRYFYEDLGVIIKAWYHYFLGNLNKENPYALTEFSATFFQGFKAEKLYLKAKKAFDKELKFDLNEGMKILIRDHQYRGHKIILITEM
ncbi:MAG: hypothetical protein NT091_02320, partial [Candidatus Falkowbacteria bacterium]|nr:hypothetical protein [Candidatus Falkowbacteria bacterium]